MPYQYDTLDEWTWQRWRFSLTGVYNRSKDTLTIVGNAPLEGLHTKVRQHLRDTSEHWEGYDYGHGYLYQSCPALHFSGRRDTLARIEALAIRRYANGGSVLDIGCNSGFVALEVAREATHVTGFDVNPSLIAIARDSAEHLKLRNTEFLTSAFSEFNSDTKFDVILSLSNHFTYDGEMSPTIRDYLERCKTWLKTSGTFIFESHTPKFEARHSNFEELKGNLDEFFSPVFVGISSTGTPLDRNRLIYIGATAK